MPTLPLTLPSVMFTGSAGGLNADVPGRFDVAIGGRGYFIDWEQREGYQFRTVPLLRQQSDTGETVGSQSINPEGLWRRSVEEWFIGAGQDDYDRPSSDSARFRSSKGVDVWTRGRLTLLPDTAESLSSSNTNLKVLSAGGRLYVADGQTARFTTDPYAASPSYTAVTGTAVADITALASTGYHVMIAQGASGIYLSDTGSTSASSWITGGITDVAYVKNRVMASYGVDLYEITHNNLFSGTHAKPSALYSHEDTSWTWVGFAEGTNHIYAAGYSGDKSEIFRMTLQADGTALTAPSIAGRLPDGEIVTGVYGYLGFLLIGSNKGFRLAVQDTNGNLTLGALIETGSTVRAFEGQGQYVWFTWEAYDSTSSGLGRMDLANLSDRNALVPAYASDLMTTSQANVASVATFDGKRVFTVSGDGFYAQDTDLVAEGSLDSGLINYGLAERKTAVNFKLNGDFADGGTITVMLAANEGVFDSLGAATSASDTSFSADEATGTRHEVRVKLARSSTDNTKGPKLLSWTLQGYPRSQGSQIVVIPVLLRSIVDVPYREPERIDIVEERDALDSLWRQRTLTTFQEGSRSHIGIIEDLIWTAESPSDLQDDFGQAQGTVTVRFKIIEGAY